MKCFACGYEHEEEWNRDNRCGVATKGDKKFIPVYFEHTVKVDNPEAGKYGGWGRLSDYIDTVVSACPKCGTLKIDVDDI